MSPDTRRAIVARALAQMQEKLDAQAAARGTQPLPPPVTTPAPLVRVAQGRLDFLTRYIRP